MVVSIELTLHLKMLNQEHTVKQRPPLAQSSGRRQLRPNTRPCKRPAPSSGSRHSLKVKKLSEAALYSA